MKRKFGYFVHSEGETIFNLDYKGGKKFLFVFILSAILLYTLVFIFDPNFNKGDKNFLFLIIPWVGFLSLYYFIIHPLSVVIKKKKDGSVEIIKTDWFFRRNIYSILSQYNPYFRAKRRRFTPMAGGVRIFVRTPAYQPRVCYTDQDGQEKCIDLTFKSASYTKNVPTGHLSKEQLEEISTELGLRLLIEE